MDEWPLDRQQISRAGIRRKLGIRIASLIESCWRQLDNLGRSWVRCPCRAEPSRVESLKAVYFEICILPLFPSPRSPDDGRWLLDFEPCCLESVVYLETRWKRASWRFEWNNWCFVVKSDDEAAGLSDDVHFATWNSKPGVEDSGTAVPVWWHDWSDSSRVVVDGIFNRS